MLRSLPGACRGLELGGAWSSARHNSGDRRRLSTIHCLQYLHSFLDLKVIHNFIHRVCTGFPQSDPYFFFFHRFFFLGSGRLWEAEHPLTW
jgi:hypothetical protein